jgi:hypothetical protein
MRAGGESAEEVAAEMAARDRAATEQFISAAIDYWIAAHDIEGYPQACNNAHFLAFAPVMSLVNADYRKQQALAVMRQYRAAAPPVDIARGRLGDRLATLPAYSGFGETGHLEYPTLEPGPVLSLEYLTVE